MINENTLFYFFSFSLVICSIVVVLSSQPIFSLLALVTCFLFSSFLLLLLECELLAILFLMLYVGAIAILFLFAVMMLDSKQENLEYNKMKYVPIGLLFGIGLLIPLLYEIHYCFTGISYYNTFYWNTYQNWYDLIDSVPDVEVYGHVLYSYFVLQFLIVGLILLLVLVGVAYLTNTNNPHMLKQSIPKQLSRSSNFFFK